MLNSTEIWQGPEEKSANTWQKETQREDPETVWVPHFPERQLSEQELRMDSEQFVGLCGGNRHWHCVEVDFGLSP